jgi:hypothetical protein
LGGDSERSRWSQEAESLRQIRLPCLTTRRQSSFWRVTFGGYAQEGKKAGIDAEPARGRPRSMPLRRAGRAAGRTAVIPFGLSSRCRTRSRLCARKRRGHLPRDRAGPLTFFSGHQQRAFLAERQHDDLAAALLDHFACGAFLPERGANFPPYQILQLTQARLQSNSGCAPGRSMIPSRTPASEDKRDGGTGRDGYRRTRHRERPSRAAEIAVKPGRRQRAGPGVLRRPGPLPGGLPGRPLCECRRPADLSAG